MDRDKLIERARKLLAMSEDLSSPTEAAIADRRLKVLMVKHDISIEEIKRTERGYSSQARHEDRQTAPVRRKRTRSSVQWKQPQSSVRPNRIFAMVAMFGFVAAALSLWITFTGVEGARGPITENFQTHQLEKSPRYGTPSLTTRVDRTSVFKGESIVLYIKGSGISAKPNTSSLWQDFKIIGADVTESPNSQDFQIRMMLQPRRTGTLIIPSFYADEVRSELIIMDILHRK